MRDKFNETKITKIGQPHRILEHFSDYEPGSQLCRFPFKNFDMLAKS